MYFSHLLSSTYYIRFAKESKKKECSKVFTYVPRSTYILHNSLLMHMTQGFPPFHECTFASTQYLPQQTHAIKPVPLTHRVLNTQSRPRCTLTREPCAWTEYLCWREELPTPSVSSRAGRCCPMSGWPSSTRTPRPPVPTPTLERSVERSIIYSSTDEMPVQYTVVCSCPQ